MEMVDIPEPTVQEGEVLVRVEKVSICGSDIRPFAAVLEEEKYPLHPGRPTHECVGVVEESLCEEFNPGQRVIAFPYCPVTSTSVVSRPQHWWWSGSY